VGPERCIVSTDLGQTINPPVADGFAMFADKLQEQVELAGLGAMIEHCFTTMHTGKAPWEAVLESIRRVGPERCIVSTDLGQTINPPVADGFAMFADKLLEGGFNAEQVRRMAVTNPSDLMA
jgi:predicted metal-dependent TIM-barrel fold hydrolase